MRRMAGETEKLIHRGREAFENRDYVAALADFREVLDANPGFADIRHLAGLCLSFLGQPEAALSEFDEALKLNECYIEAHLNRAITLNELGRYDEAAESFDEAGRCEQQIGGRFPAAVSARLANAHLAVGDLYLATSAPEEAAAEFRQALALRPNFLDIRNRLGEALMQLGQLDEAEEELSRALAGNDQFLQARLNLGLVFYRRGDLGRAREEWERCRKQRADNPQVDAFLMLLNRSAAAAGGDES